MLEKLKEEVFQANLDLVKYGLVTLTWGNVSGINHEDGLIVIKPSGVNYNVMKPSDMVIVDLDGKVIESELRPSSDTPTHIELYKAFPHLGGIAHTHSMYATVFAQACKEIHCLGTTHADHFYGSIPVTRFLTEEEVESGYEKNTGTVIIERLKGIDTVSMPGILVAGHAPFGWGKNSAEAVKNSLVLERVAQMALHTYQLSPNIDDLPKHIINKHYKRKHGPNAYYGQK